ncbi:MAG: sugar transferase [Candidatus Omnitrophica bacterium]|nr:sugar transferase [Candidatus Omnitrophota bacterium]
MYRDKRKIYALYLIIDIILIGFSYYLAYFLRDNLHFIPISMATFRQYSLAFILWGVSLIFFLNNFHLYYTDRSLTIPQEAYLVFKAVFYSAILSAVIIFGFKIEFFSRIIFLSVSVLLFINLSSWRILKRIFIRYTIIRGYNNFNVLIIGAGRSGKELADEIKDNPYLGLKIVGFLDDYKTDAINGYRVIGKIQDLEKIAQKKFVDEIYITIPSERKVVSEILSKANLLGKTVRVLADNFEIPRYQVKINYLGFLPLVSYYEKGIHGTDSLIKRALDMIIATTAMTILLPLLLIISFLIKLDSPGPMLYVSRRAGRKGRIFNFYKFRSMYKDADREKETLRHKSEVKGPIFKIKNDHRITRLGKFLRRYSLDELPQLINVLKGDMTLVGPRPLPVDESEQCQEWQLRRLDVKPGIACMAQVRGRSDISFYKWMKWDLWYIDNWSLGLDFNIMFWMVPAVLKRKGAY